MRPWHIVAETCRVFGLQGVELVVATIDLDACDRSKQTAFGFHRYRRPSRYGPITAPHAPPSHDSLCRPLRSLRSDGRVLA